MKVFRVFIIFTLVAGFSRPVCGMDYATNVAATVVGSAVDAGDGVLKLGSWLASFVISDKQDDDEEGEAKDDAGAMPKKWDEEYAQECLTGYKYGILKTYFDAMIVTDDSPTVLSWINEKAARGHVICLYIQSRIFAHKIAASGVAVTKEEYVESLTRLLLLFYRVAIDLVKLNIFTFGPPPTTITYSCFVAKFEYLLRDKIAQFEKIITFAEAKEAVAARVATLAENPFSYCIGTGLFWYRSSTGGMGCYSIEDELLEHFTLQELRFNADRAKFAAHVTSVFADVDSWVNFFKFMGPFISGARTKGFKTSLLE